MKKFTSAAQFFGAFRALTDRIERQGCKAAADELRSGFSALNGLTDGWAMLMQSIEKALSLCAGAVEEADVRELEDMLKFVRRTVYRR